MNPVLWNIITFFSSMIDASTKIMLITALLGFSLSDMRRPLLFVALPSGILLFVLHLLEVKQNLIAIMIVIVYLLLLMIFLNSKRLHVFVTVFIGTIIAVMIEFIAFQIMVSVFGFMPDELINSQEMKFYTSFILWGLTLLVLFLILRFQLRIFRKVG